MTAKDDIPLTTGLLYDYPLAPDVYLDGLAACQSPDNRQRLSYRHRPSARNGGATVV